MLELFRAHPLTQTRLDNKRIIKHGNLIRAKIKVNNEESNVTRSKKCAILLSVLLNTDTAKCSYLFMYISYKSSQTINNANS